MNQSLNKTVTLLNRLGYEVVIRFTPDSIAAVIIKNGETIAAQGFTPSSNRKLAAKVEALSKTVLSPISGKVLSDDPDVNAAFPGS